MVVNQNTPIPGGVGTFDIVSDPSFDSGNIAFLGSDSSGFPFGIYTDIGGELVDVIDINDMLDGKPLDSLGFASDQGGLSGNQIAFLALFEDGSQGVFVATVVPEPTAFISSLAGLGLASVFVKMKTSARRHHTL
jgi:hypothetical protein